MIDYPFFFLEKVFQFLSDYLHHIRLNTVNYNNKYKNLTDIKLDLGCGRRKRKGFIGIDAYLYPNVDINYNLNSGIPFNSNSVSEIHSNHFLEHLSNKEFLLVIKECYRTLKPGGKITLTVPDLEAILISFLNDNEKGKWSEGWKWIYGNQNHPFEYHKTGFTKKKILHILKKNNFKNIQVNKNNSGYRSNLTASAYKK